MTVRTTTPKGAATRLRLVDAAAELFHEQGVGATGLADVLTASGTGKSQLYHYFDSKSELVDTVIDIQAGRIHEWHSALLAGVTDTDGLRTWAGAVVAAVAGAHGGRGCPLGSLSTELADRSEAHRARVAHGFARWQQLLADAVGRVRSADGERRPNPDADAAVLLAAVQGGLLLANATHDVEHLRLALAAAIDRLDTPAAPAARAGRRRGR